MAQKGKNVLSMSDWIGKRYSQKHSQNWLDSEVLIQGIKYIRGYNFPLIILLLGNRKKEPTEGDQETEHTGKNMLSKHASCIGKM